MGVFLGSAMAIAVSAFVISVFWPVYTWDLSLPSPDGQYDIVVLRGDAAAFADFSYSIYLFPRTKAPRDQARDTRILLWGIWRNDEYLDMPFTVSPVMQFSSAEKAILISLNFGKQDKSNVEP